MPIIQTDEFTEIRDEEGTLLVRMGVYRWQCESDRCLRRSRDMDTDGPGTHPECEPYQEGNS